MDGAGARSASMDRSAAGVRADVRATYRKRIGDASSANAVVGLYR
jgi:hypothetical protein